MASANESAYPDEDDFRDPMMIEIEISEPTFERLECRAIDTKGSKSAKVRFDELVEQAIGTESDWKAVTRTLPGPVVLDPIPQPRVRRNPMLALRVHPKLMEAWDRYAHERGLTAEDMARTVMYELTAEAREARVPAPDSAPRGPRTIGGCVIAACLCCPNGCTKPLSWRGRWRCGCPRST